MGFIRGKKAYLADKSNWLDFFVVAISVVDFAGDDMDLGALSSLRLLRILRVLRAVKRVKSLNQYVMLLLRSIPMMASTMATLIMILLIFGILGVQVCACLCLFVSVCVHGVSVCAFRVSCVRL